MLIISTHLFLQRAPLFLWVLPPLLLPRFSSVSLLQFGLQNLFLSLWSLLLRLLSHEDASKYVSFFFLFFWFCHIFAPFFYFFNCCLFSKSGISELDCLCLILIAVFFFWFKFIFWLVGVAEICYHRWFWDGWWDSVLITFVFFLCVLMSLVLF